MKREERTLLNQLRKNVTPDTINVEIPVSYTHEGRQAIHELLTIEKGLYAPCIYWNDILGEYCVHYEHTMGDPTATATKRDQETLDIDEVTAELPRRDRTWTGYPKPTETTSKSDLKGDTTMTTVTTIAAIAAIINLADDMQYAYYFIPPYTARERRAYEEKHSISKVEWDEGGRHYTAEYTTTCSGHNVYAKGVYTRDGKPTTLTAIRNSYRRLTGC